MRNKFFDTLLPIAKKDKRVIVLMSDTGATVLNQWKKELPKQVVNVGIAEQNMIGLATGLAMEGFLPYCYGIIPFVTSRCHDQIRVNVCCQRLPVTIVGVGTGYDYNTLGPTHHGVEDIAIMRALPSMRVLSPSDDVTTVQLARMTYYNPKPTYVRVDRHGKPDFHNIQDLNFPYSIYERGESFVVISTGRMSLHCKQVIDELADEEGIKGKLIDVTELKPISRIIQTITQHIHPVVVVEEHSSIGGLADAVKSVGVNVDTYIAAPDTPVRVYGNRQHLKEHVGLDNKSIKSTIKDLMNLSLTGGIL